MGSLERPKLRALSARRFEHAGQAFAALEDPLGVFEHSVLIPLDGFQLVVHHFDGNTTLPTIQDRVRAETGRSLATDDSRALVEQLDRAMVLEGPTFATFLEAYRGQLVRPSSLAGRSYPADARTLGAELDHFFEHPRGAGAPRHLANRPETRLRGVVSPHIDFQRGGPVYTWYFKELVERSDAEVLVILGVAHQYCTRRFALTKKDFETPLGTARTDRAYVARIAALAGEQFFDDERAHRAEHSVEFQVVFLQHLLRGRRDFSIVPILVGSFHDLMNQLVDPIVNDEVQSLVSALRTTEEESGKRVAYIGGIDLSHVGPEFGDPGLVEPALLDQVRGFDTAMLARAAASDPKGWFETAAKVENRWRVCGLAATYTLLHAIGTARGRLLRYDQALDDARTCCVTFASLAFDEAPEPEVSQRDRD